ncbi:MAG: TlyA family rRNA (cytidine-2'-O)-methyltransferase [Elusimicrobia bacterium CG08_land_8_20_14_0_20_59_10]|nr:MAG: TlyA family rRNA (cytidine-2'-O)-methyltransferase [Elusimicrobia bacterium CG08_land_8_20_14_0_20_59_10]
MIKKRLDIACVERGLYESREKALRAIMAGLVTVNGKPADKAGQAVREADLIEQVQDDCPYVSRGGLKLKGALDNFKIKVKGRTCLDVGVATGGFTDCLLREGAARVYAVDVGEGQLHEKMKAHPLVVFMPQTNARYLKPELFPEKPRLCAIDVSFISLKLILGPVLGVLAPGGEIIALVKPQFELQAKNLRKGIVKDEETRQQAMADLRAFLAASLPGAEEKGLIDSPLKGAKGNLEFLWHLARLK